MPIDYLCNIDLKTNHLLNAVIHPVATAPSNPVEGQIYYDTTAGDKQLYVWNGTIWQGVAHIAFLPTETTIASGDTLAFSDESESGDPNNNITINNLLGTGLQHVAAADIVAGDYITFLDGGTTGTAKKGSIHDVAVLFAGSGLTATNSVIAVVDADESTKGIVQLASEEESTTGTSETKAVTPLGVATHVESRKVHELTAPTAALAMNSQIISGVRNPALPQDAATKSYVDGAVIANTDTQNLSQSGNTVSLVDGGSVDISTTTAVAANSAKTSMTLNNTTSSTSTTVAGTANAVKVAYDRGSTGITNAASAQTTANAALPKAGGTMSDAIAMGTNKITGMGNPTANQDAATKAYTDAKTWNWNDITAGTVPTFNQNTTGSAAILTTAVNIGGVSFNGSANIDLPGVNVAGNQNTSGAAEQLRVARAIYGNDFDGSENVTGTIATAYIADDAVTEDKLADTLLAEIDANTAKVTNSNQSKSDIDGLAITTVGTLDTGNATAIVDAASATAAGKVELATTAEAITGTDTARAVTPAGLKARVSQIVNLKGYAVLQNDVFDYANAYNSDDEAPFQFDVSYGSGTIDSSTQVAQSKLFRSGAFHVPFACTVSDIQAQLTCNNDGNVSIALVEYRPSAANGNVNDYPRTVYETVVVDSENNNNKVSSTTIATGDLDNTAIPAGSHLMIMVKGDGTSVGGVAVFSVAIGLSW